MPWLAILGEGDHPAPCLKIDELPTRLKSLGLAGASQQQEWYNILQVGALAFTHGLQQPLCFVLGQEAIIADGFLELAISTSRVLIKPNNLDL